MPGARPAGGEALDRLDRRVRRRAVCVRSPRPHVATQWNAVDQSAANPHRSCALLARVSAAAANSTALPSASRGALACMPPSPCFCRAHRPMLAHAAHPGRSHPSVSAGAYPAVSALHVVADQLPLAVRGTALASPDAFRHAVRVCRLLESSHCRVLPVRAPGSQQALRCAAEYGTPAPPIQAHRLRRRTRVPARVPHRVLIPARAAHHVKPPPLRPPANTCPCRRTQPLRCSVAAHDAHQRQPCLRA